jgi:hypothetical protein
MSGSLADGRTDRVRDVALRDAREPRARVRGRPAARRQEQIDEDVLRQVLGQIGRAGAVGKAARDRRAQRAIGPVDIAIGTGLPDRAARPRIAGPCCDRLGARAYADASLGITSVLHGASWKTGRFRNERRNLGDPASPESSSNRSALER